MPKHFIPLSLLLLSFFPCCVFAQTVHGVVTDTSSKPLAFATIKLGNTKQGLMADLNGKFTIHLNGSFQYISITHLGYKPRKINVSAKDTGLLEVVMEPATAELEEVVISNSSTKLKRIMNAAIANRSRNNPDKYDWYQCKVYYKTTFDFMESDSMSVRDTSKEAKLWRERMRQQHMFITETYSKRTWERPQKLQEDVIATRISGFKKAWFTSLVTDVLPFHSYNDFILLNGKEFHNPLSSGYFQRYKMRIIDEVLKDGDTTWVISFKPKKDLENLTGTLYISSNQFAISHLIAQHYDSTLKRTVGIEQQYSFEDGKWFPEQLNYFIDFHGIFGSGQLHMKGTSSIDSVTFTKNERFRFDKAHTTRIEPGGDELADKKWKEIRPTPLDPKEERTYVFIDSIGAKHHFDNLPGVVERFMDGYLPMGKLDIDIQRLYSYNNYEKHRLGFGFRTSKKMFRRFTLGGWVGYGTGDKDWKYGGFAEVYADKFREFTFKLNYKNDIQDPGRLQLNTDLDKNFLRRFLLGRVDKVQSYSFEINKKLGYLQAGLAFQSEKITPQYNYSLLSSGKSLQQFNTNEIVLSLRYSYAERMSPMFGRYFSNGSKYPTFYGKVRFGEVTNDNNKYIHALAAVHWEKHINHIGDEEFLVMAGGIFSEKPLPLSKLFAGNGFMRDGASPYVFGGMQTMLPYEYYSDRFINFYWNHDFDFKFYRLKLSKSFSSSPKLAFGYNVLWGKLKNIDAHQNIHFSVPEPAFHETGLMLNRVLRMKFMGMTYIDLNVGSFYHLNGKFDYRQNGKFVIGVSADL